MCRLKSSQMDLTYYGSPKEFKVGPRPKIPFLGQFCQPYWQCQRDLANFMLIVVALH